MKRAILSLSLFLVCLGFLLAAPGLFAEKTHLFTVYAEASSLCKNAGSGCDACFNSGGAWTELGCVGAGGSPEEFISKLLEIGIGMGGGVAFLLILFSGFQTMMSAGNPEKLHEAKELMTAAISGLLLIIFSVFLLKLVGVDILQIPGLSN